MSITQQDWDDSAGLKCDDCNRLSLRIVDGLCLGCYNKRIAWRDAIKEYKAERKYFKSAVRRGTIKISDLRKGEA